MDFELSEDRQALEGAARAFAGAALGALGRGRNLPGRLAARLGMRPDFREGVWAVIVDKDNKPAWDPATLAGMTDARVDEIFAPLPVSEGWTPLPGL